MFHGKRPGLRRRLRGSYNQRVIAKEVYRWRFRAACPPREIFSTMEQALGVYPFRYQVTGDRSARIIEFQRKGLFGNWTKRLIRPVQWVACEVEQAPNGIIVTVTCSRRSRIGGRDPAPTRALQLIRLLSRGTRDARTIYRERVIPPGPVTLPASWAGTGYQLFTEPSFDAPRGTSVLTASRVEAVEGGNSTFVKVRLADGTEGYIERDQLVVAPEAATREAQLEAARFV
jgi:hypothetical protein